MIGGRKRFSYTLYETGRDKDLFECERAELELLRKENVTLRTERNFAKKGSGLIHETTAVKCAAIADWAQENEYPVTFMCAELGMCRQGFYRWRPGAL